jgi:hypothetical protein
VSARVEMVVRRVRFKALAWCTGVCVCGAPQRRRHIITYGRTALAGAPLATMLQLGRD